VRWAKRAAQKRWQNGLPESAAQKRWAKRASKSTLIQLFSPGKQSGGGTS